ncbi:ferrochelatase-like [Condylostylus longicornis]|uniref:ferrochelatase-like n=1 Tax=Condylostylus longicornis TaxID=2530218 RepID=UPI00244DCBE1|nr:ferrochelatase-like [Condylostylus longicornis]
MKIKKSESILRSDNATEVPAGVLLVNLGTPTAATPTAVRKFLAPFLRDRRVVDVSPCLWLPLLHGVILPLRCSKVAKRYQAIWMDEGSPLFVYSQRQQQALATQLGPNIPVAIGMSYGDPSIAASVDALLSQGVKRLIVLPLFPQYCSSTTAAAWDALASALRNHRNLPEVRFICDYATHPQFIWALQEKIESSFATHGTPDKLLFSYHGILQKYVRQGDEYPQRCQATTDAVANGLALKQDRYLLSYQSRFGYGSWLGPYTDNVISQLAKDGVRHLQVVTPGFSSDCLETLEEIADEAQSQFLKAGGEKLHYIPALNDSKSHIELLHSLVIEELQSSQDIQQPKLF